MRGLSVTHAETQSSQTQAETCLHAEGLSRSFGFRQVLRDLSFSVHQGEVVAVCGPNGSGKSTLLRMLAGLLAPSAGRTWVSVAGQPLPDEQRWDVVALAAPAINPYMHLTLAENLSFMSRTRGVKSASPHELAVMAGLDGRADDLVGSYSTGMIQRTRLALALAIAPRVLLLDEPGHCLDGSGREMLTRLVDRQRKHGLCLIATNDAQDRDLADREITLGQEAPL